MAQFSDKDQYYMLCALDFAKKVKGTTFPNPAVGAVIVKGGAIIGGGATAYCGGPHAEKTALLQAGINAQGATLYVTLEPCCHFGRTPPCTDAIIAAGIKKVFFALRDPNPLVAGKGGRQLRRYGIEVASGCLAKEAMRLNEDFVFSILHHRAFITLKLALTLDGYIADYTGGSRWITSPALRKIVHDLRRTHAAVAVGRGTFDADNPKLNVRSGKRTAPARIVFSSTGKIPGNTYFYQHSSDARSIVVIRRKTESRVMIDGATGIEYWFTGESDRHASMAAFAAMAYANNLTSILVEGGSGIASVLLESELVNRLYLFYGNKLLGGGVPGIRIGKNGRMIDAAIVLKNRETVMVDNDFYITGEIAAGR